MNTNRISLFEESVEGFLFIGDLGALKEVIYTVLHEYNLQVSFLNIIFVDDERLRSMNKDYLNEDSYTDVITFNLSDDPEIIEGELYISIYRVVANADQFNVLVGTELERVIIHGVLHLVGLNDKTESEGAEMKRLESYYLNLLNAY